MIKEQTKDNQSLNEALRNFAELISNINLLKSKNDGCPWQKMQTHETLLPYLIEESHEFIDSIKNNDKENMKEELGDLLLQIMLHSEIESEKNLFSIKDVINSLNYKIKSRHPYVFKKRTKVSIEEAEQIWKDMKTKNKSNKIKKGVLSNLHSEYLTPIEEAKQINFQVEKYGFKWDNKNEILNKLYEEIEELKLALNIEDKVNIEEEFGDIFFTLISLSVYLEINPDKALRSANEKFKERFFIIEKILGDKIFNQSTQNFRELWTLAKEKLQTHSKNQNDKK
tara:strand:+ start:70 stop:918 length:849 start_codon:yes stop_codon:yes gene_type:complete